MFSLTTSLREPKSDVMRAVTSPTLNRSKNSTFCISTLLNIRALKVDITFSHTVLMFITKITVKIGSSIYNTPTVLSSLHNDSGLVPISTSKKRPENKGIESVHVVQPQRANTETASLSLCRARRLHRSPPVTAFNAVD